MNVTRIARRFLVPSFVVTAVYWFKYRCFVSPRAEVDLSSELTIGSKTQISAFCKVKAMNGPLSIGKSVSIGPGCFVSTGAGGLEIGDHCMVAANTSIVANNHRYEDLNIPMREQGNSSEGIRIADDVWIGTSCSILDGTTIERGVIISAGSVVSGKIPQYSIVQGNPGKVIFERR